MGLREADPRPIRETYSDPKPIKETYAERLFTLNLQSLDQRLPALKSAITHVLLAAAAVCGFTIKNPTSGGQKCLRGEFFDGFTGPREGFLTVFQNFWGRRRVFLRFFDGFLAASEKVAKEGFLRVFYIFRGRGRVF